MSEQIEEEQDEQNNGVGEPRGEICSERRSYERQG
jgi:hypothetical protein